MKLGREDVPWMELLQPAVADGRMGELAYVLRDQVVMDHDEMRAEVETLLVMCSAAAGAGGGRTIRYTSAGLLRECLIACDPARADDEPGDTDAYAQYAAQLPAESGDAAWHSAVPLYALMARARGWCLLRVGRKVEKAKGWAKALLTAPGIRQERAALTDTLRAEVGGGPSLAPLPEAVAEVTA